MSIHVAVCQIDIVNTNVSIVDIESLINADWIIIQSQLLTVKSSSFIVISNTSKSEMKIHKLAKSSQDIKQSVIHWKHLPCMVFYQM